MFERHPPRSFRHREPSLSAWRDYDGATVARVLDLVANAFFWKDEDARRLRPDDHLWPIYWTYLRPVAPDVVAADQTQGRSP